MEIRADWSEVEIVQVLAKLENGKELMQGWSPQCKKTPSPSEDIWGVLKTSAIQPGEFVEVENKELPEDKEPKEQLEVKAGDILLTCAGPRNRCGVPCMVLRTRKRLMISGKMYRFRANEEVVDKRFLHLYLQSQKAWNAIDKMKSGGNESGLNLTHGRFKKLTVPVAPLPEQRAIVSKIEELYSELDNGIANLKIAQEQLKVYRQAVLKKAFEGELTKEWRAKQKDLPTAEELLQNVLSQYSELEKAKHIKKVKPIDRFNLANAPYSIPDNWGWCNLGDVSRFYNGDRGKNYPNKSEYVNSGVPWINTGHIEPDGSLSLERMNYITREKFESLRSGDIQEGDLVYCLRGATFGKTAFVFPFKEGSIASSLMIIRPHENLDDRYLFHYLISAQGKKQLNRFDNGSAQPNLSANMVRLYAFPFCSLEEQHQIVQEIESRLSVCDKLEESIAQSLQKAESLRQSILKKAFEGRLLTEEELAACRKEKDWEPAMELLKRVNHENENKKAKAK